MRKVVLSLLLCLLPALAAAQDIIPKPVSVEFGAGEFTVKHNVGIRCCPESVPAAEYLLEKIGNAIPLRRGSVKAVSGFRGGKGDIQLYIDSGLDVPAEGYRLSVTPEKVVIAGKDYGGVFNGVQTLLQLFPPLVYDETGWFDTSISAPCVEIADWPRFGYRGMHLDIARTYSDKREVLLFIERLAYHKINKFHWHLTDDEGWRVEIKSRPELAETGGFRGGDSPVFPIYGAWDRKYGGYFTHEDIREVVEFARVRNIEIIPEIDLPGHSRTAGKVYPHILCDGPAHTAASGGYDMRDVWCVSKEENYEILDDILREISELFPSEYIHIGGDEVNMEQWNKCPLCRETMKEQGLGNGHELEGYFMARLEGILAEYGKKPVVWNEAVQGGSRLSGDVRVHGWENVEVCKEVAERGFKTVVMPGKYFYLDMKYTPAEPGMTWAGIVSTDTVYSFDFDALGFTPQQMENVLGVQGAFWSEVYLDHDRDYLYRMVYPRLCALAEVAWTPDGERNRDDFISRLDTHYGRLERMGVDYRREPAPAPQESLLRPAFTFTSSMNARRSNPFSNLTGYLYGTTSRTTRTCNEGDWLLYEFTRPVSCERIEFVSGYSYLRRSLIPFGYVEVKYEGSDEFVHYADFMGGKVTIRPEKALKAFRVVSMSKMNGDSTVILQPLRIIAD